MGCRKLDILDKNQHGLKVVHKASAVKLKRCADAWRWEYYIKDHLGNIRISFSDLNDDGEITVALDETNEILEENHYYPFGMKQNGPWLKRKDQGFKNKYNYNGKEEMPFTGYFDYEARTMDPSIGRFLQVDPLADNQLQVDKSPFAYTWNNPINLNDPDGLCPWPCSELKQRAVNIMDGIKEGLNNAGKAISNFFTSDAVDSANDAVEILTDEKTDTPNFEGKSSLNKVAKSVGPVLDVVSTAVDAINTDFSDPEQKEEFVQNTVQTAISAIPTVGPMLGAISERAKDPESVLNLDNGKASNAYSTSRNRASGMAKAFAERRKRDAFKLDTMLRNSKERARIKRKNSPPFGAGHYD